MYSKEYIPRYSKPKETILQYFNHCLVTTKKKNKISIIPGRHKPIFTSKPKKNLKNKKARNSLFQPSVLTSGPDTCSTISSPSNRLAAIWRPPPEFQASVAIFFRWNIFGWKITFLGTTGVSACCVAVSG